MHNNIPVDPMQGPIGATIVVLVSLVMLVFVVAFCLDLKDEITDLKERRNRHD